MELTIGIIQLGVILIIIGILLNNWKPPIKEQYIFIILGAVGMILGHVLKCGIAWGFILAGLVFYKSKLIEEFKLVKEAISDLEKLRLLKTDKSKEDQKDLDK